MARQGMLRGKLPTLGTRWQPSTHWRGDCMWRPFSKVTGSKTQPHPYNFWCTVRMFFFNLQCTHTLECTASILQKGPLLDLWPSRGCQKPLTWFKADWEAVCTTEGNLFSKNTTATQSQVTDKLWFCRLKDLAGVSEMNEIICHFKENNWQLCLPMIKFEHSSKNQNFGKLVSTATSLTVFQ